MTDKFEIFELMNNYILSIDSHNNEQFADNFTEDGIYDSPWGIAEGREAILGNISYRYIRLGRKISYSSSPILFGVLVAIF